MPTTFERVLQQAAVNPRFRSESGEFGLDRLPESVQEQDQHFFELLSDGMESAGVMYGCSSTCSYGIITAVCDGNTKSG